MPKGDPKTLKTQKSGVPLLAVALGAVIIIQVLFFSLLIFEETNIKRKEAQADASKSADMIRSVTDNFFGRYLSIFETLKSIDHVQRQDTEETARILRRLNESHPEAVNFAAVKQNGDFFASGKPYPDGKAPNISHIEFFNRIISGEKLVIMQPHPGPISQDLVTGVVVPLDDDAGQIRGLIGVSIQFAALTKRWMSTLPKSDVLMAVHDSNGSRVFASPDLDGMSPDSLIQIQMAESRETKYRNMNFIIENMVHPDSGWRFSILVPVHSDLLGIVMDRKDLITILGLMVITIAALCFLLYQEQQWTDKLQIEQAKLKESEEHLRALVDHSADAIGISQKGIHTWVNPAYLKIFGYGHGDELTGKPILDLIAPEERKRIQAYVAARDRGEPVSTHYMTRGLKKDGTRFDMEVTVARYGMEGGVNTLAILRDITQRIKLEEHLRQAQKLEAIGTLAGGIAHDFNNILTPLLGFAELLKEDLPKDSPNQKPVAEIIQASLRAKTLVRQILEFSRKSEREKAPVNIQPILEEAARLIRATIPKNIDIQTHIAPDCRPIIADPGELLQAVMNLATNAFHSMQDKGGQLDILLCEKHVSEDSSKAIGLHPGQYAMITVKDTGTGIEKEIQDRIFDPYFSTKPKEKGTGLGLSIVQGIVKGHDGEIKMVSEPGKGTQFHLFFPLTHETPPVLTGSMDKTDPNAMTGKERILLIDDEAAIARMEEIMLRRMGYETTAETSSLNAIELFKAGPDRFDLILTDMNMPGMTGLELSKAIREIRKDIPIIICSGFNEQVDEDNIAGFDIQGYVSKPVGKHELTLAIRRVLDKHRPV